MSKKANLIATLAVIAVGNPDGFTVNARTLEDVKTGYAVALAATQNSFGTEGLEKVVNYVMRHKNVNAFGGWKDSESGLYYWDATVICDSLDKAMELARLNKQIAIFHLDTLTEIRVK